MNKQELINKLTELFKYEGKGHVQYNAGVIDSIRLIHGLVEYLPPTADGNAPARTLDPLQRTIKLIRENFSATLNAHSEATIAQSINDKLILQAVKQYRDVTGLDLKICKQDVDAVRHKLGTL